MWLAQLKTRAWLLFTAVYKPDVQHVSSVCLAQLKTRAWLLFTAVYKPDDQFLVLMQSPDLATLYFATNSFLSDRFEE